MELFKDSIQVDGKTECPKVWDSQIIAMGLFIWVIGIRVLGMVMVN